MGISSIILLVLGVVALIVLIATAVSSFFTVDTAEVAIVQRLGKFARIASAGLNWKTPFIEAVVGKASLQVQQFDVKVETKTKDNVFVNIPVSIQYFIMPDKVYDAWYKLSNHKQQMTSYIFNIILGHVPTMTLDETFERQSQIAIDIKKSLETSMAEFGYGITKVLVTDIIPAEEVKQAMNSINAAQRDQEAAKAKGEAEKILKVKQAEAEADSKILQGKGIAGQRKAIIEGLRESVEAFRESVEGATAKDVMSLVLMTQYFDTLKEVGAQAKTNTLMIPNSPGAVGDFMSQIQASMTASNQVSQNAAETKPRERTAAA
jgi:regulator of protease activity HflC (stomatin/prohibitin superfamily)